MLTFSRWAALSQLAGTQAVPVTAVWQWEAISVACDPEVRVLLFPGRPMPDIETLMQEWSPEFEELLGKVRCPGCKRLARRGVLETAFRESGALVPF